MSFAKRSQLHVELLNDRIVPSATVLNLTTAGAVGTAPNGAIVEQTNPQAAGVSPVKTFVRLQDNWSGTEQGYNTNGWTSPFDDAVKSSHAITLGQVPVVTVNGESYLEFFLGVKDKDKRSSPDVTLDEVQIFLGSSKTLTEYNANKNTLAGKSAVFDLDSAGNVSVKLDADLSSSKGSWNMALLVPVADFAGANPNSSLYLYSKLEEQDCFSDVSVKWGIGTTSSSPPPPPTGGSLAGTVLVGGTTVPISGVTILLQGTDSQGNTVNLSTTTLANGTFSFTNLAAGTYSIIEQVPQNDIVTSETVGTVNGAANGTADQSDSQFTGITISSGQNGIGYIFGDSTGG